MKTLFTNFWITSALMVAVAILDLIGLPIYNFGVGAVVVLAYFAVGSFFQFPSKKE